MYCKNYKVNCMVTAFNKVAYLMFIFRSESDDEVSLFVCSFVFIFNLFFSKPVCDYLEMTFPFNFRACWMKCYGFTLAQVTF